MAPYWSAGGPGASAAGRRRASSAGTSSGSGSGSQGPGPLGRKTSSAGEAYQRIVGPVAPASSTRNPIYGLADSVAGSASDDTSGSSRHYVDPWDLENFMYLKRHWAAEDAEASSTPALETGAQSDFYYVGGPLDPDVDHLDAYPGPAMYRPDSVLLAEEPLSLAFGPGGPASLGVMNAVEEESFFNERYDPSRHHRLVRRSHSAAATYLHHEPQRAQPARPAPRDAHAYAGRRRSVACAPRYYRTPITGGDSSGEYEAFEDYADELSRRLGAVDLEPSLESGLERRAAAPRSKRHSVAVPMMTTSSSRPRTSHQMSHQMPPPRSRASIAGPAPVLTSRMPPHQQPVRRRHSHCVAWSAPSPAPAPAPAHIYSTRRASFSRGQLLAGLPGMAGLHAAHAGRYASDLAYGGSGGGALYGNGTPYGTAGSSDDCYVSDGSDEYGDGAPPSSSAAPSRKDAIGGGGGVASDGAPVVDGFTDADLVYAQLASSLYGDAGYGYCGQPSYDCSRFQLTNYGHLKIDYSCSWRSLDAYIAHS